MCVFYFWLDSTEIKTCSAWAQGPDHCCGAQLCTCILPCSCSLGPGTGRLQCRSLSLKRGLGLRCTRNALQEGCTPGKLLGVSVQGELKGLISLPCIFCRFTRTGVAQWDVLDPPTRLWFGVRSLLVTSVSTSQNQRKWLHKFIWALKFYYLDCINQLFLSAPIKDKNPSILFKIPCFYQVCGCGFLAGKETNENI